MRITAGGSRRAIDIPAGIDSTVANMLRQINAAAAAPLLTIEVQNVCFKSRSRSDADPTQKDEYSPRHADSQRRTGLRYKGLWKQNLLSRRYRTSPSETCQIVSHPDRRASADGDAVCRAKPGSCELHRVCRTLAMGFGLCPSTAHAGPFDSALKVPSDPEEGQKETCPFSAFPTIIEKCAQGCQPCRLFVGQDHSVLQHPPRREVTAFQKSLLP